MSAPVYDPTRTYVVDSCNTSYLVRGNEPLKRDEKTFAYDEMNAKLKSLIGGSFDLTGHTLLDVSIIDDNPSSERPLLEAEFGAYGISEKDFDTLFPWPGSWPPVANNINVQKQYGKQVCGHPGSIIWYPVQGCTDQDNCKAVEPTQYKFIAFIDFLRHLLETGDKTVIYFHCEHGHDRTSATHASYLIKYKGKTAGEAMDNPPPEGAKIFTHPWEPTYAQLVQYYAGNYQK